MKLGVIMNVAEAQAKMKETLSHAQRSILAGVQDASNAAKNSLRDMTRAAFRGNRLPNTWHSKMYGRTSMNPAALDYSSAPEIMRAFAEGVTFRNSHGRFIAIPTNLVPRRGGRRMKPEDFDDSPTPLRFVPPAGARGVGLLVLDDTRINKRGSLRLASATATRRGKTATAVLFILVPEVTLRKRIDPQPLVSAAAAEIPANILKHLQEKV